MAQSAHNHRRFYPIFHFFLVPILLLAIVLSVIAVCREQDFVHYMVLFLVSVIFLTAYTARTSALRAQDRAIRAEESLRYFILAGKMIPSNLRMGQIIALRFASDGELLGLAERAIKEQLTPKQIKSAIIAWKEDSHRV